jgi:two-component system, NtrC family, response regulator HydG
VHHAECQLKDRSRSVVNLMAYPLLNQQGRFSGAVMVVRDETRLVDLEGKLEERQQLQRLIGRSAGMQKVYGLIDALSNVQTTVLITGESGTGKELVAEALHYRGARSQKALVKVNCGALPETLLESELFGHVKGAFTGAVHSQVGRFQRAHGGTIFLDEIGDVSPKIQLGLLRVLQERVFERLGDATPIKVDVRVVAATNRNLQEKVRRGEFREDLYYRLKVVEVPLPPLRERREDIALLVEHFLKQFNKSFGRAIVGVSADVQRIFLGHPWPGNVRQLEHTLEHAFVLCRNRVITLDHLPPDFLNGVEPLIPRPRNTPQDELAAILQALEQTAGNKAKAARLLGIDRKTLYRKMEKLQVNGEPL